MMRKLLLLFAVFVLLFFSSSFSYAQEKIRSEYFQGVVVVIEEQGKKEIQNRFSSYQILKVELENQQTITINHGTDYTINDNQILAKGDKVVVEKTTLPDGTQNHFIIDRYRLSDVYLLIGIFFVVILLVAGKRGITSIIGLSTTVLILVYYIIPQIANGKDPLTITLIGSLFIIFASIFIAHGINKRTTLAVFSTVVSLCLSIFLAFVFVNLAKLTGSGSENAYSLQFGNLSFINLKGLLLAGIIIGALGVLDDITINQTTLIGEFKATNNKLNLKALYKKGMTVGKEHIASLVNTLLLAYASTSLPIFLFLMSSQNNQPLWAIVNSEFVVEELVRTLVGSTTLILAVPLSTIVAAFFYAKNISFNKKSDNNSSSRGG